MWKPEIGIQQCKTCIMHGEALAATRWSSVCLCEVCTHPLTAGCLQAHHPTFHKTVGHQEEQPVHLVFTTTSQPGSWTGQHKHHQQSACCATPTVFATSIFIYVAIRDRMASCRGCASALDGSQA